MISIILEQLTHILAKVRISFSHEEEILIAAKDVITPPKVNKEESTLEESCISEGEHMFELGIEEDEERISGDHHAIKSYIEQWIQVSTRLDQLCFHFYFINSYFQHLIFYIILYSRFSFSKLKDNFGLLLLNVCFH